MTTDQEALKERMARVRSFRGAKVSVTQNPPVLPIGGRRRRSNAAFLAEHSNERLSTRETQDGVTTTHNRPGTMTMYKPLEQGGYAPKTVSVSSLPVLLNQGWSEFCPDCGKEHLDRQGRPTTDPNACSARDPVAVRACPVCRKRIYDNIGNRLAVEEDDDDPNLIKDEQGILTTPETRTRLSLDIHLWSRHPRQAQMMGRPPLPLALREIAEAAQAAV